MSFRLSHVLPLSAAALVLLAIPTAAHAGPLPPGATPCADEGGTCTFEGARVVFYGANGTFVHKDFTGSTACSNDVFGDPVPGVVKACFTAIKLPPNATQCAAEGGTCTFNGPRMVYYGADGVFTSKRLTNGATCTNEVFGDPVPGVVKACYTLR